MRPGGALVAIALTAALALPARAVVVSEDPLEGDSLSLGGAVRDYNLVLVGGPLSLPGYDPGSIVIVAVRPELELKRASGFQLVLHDELVSISSTLPRASVGDAISLGRGRRAPLFLPLEWTAVDEGGYELHDEIAWVYARQSFGALSVSIGRQPITLGRGQIWTPEDLLAPFSPLEIDTEYKPGVDALRLDLGISEAATLFLAGVLGAPEPADDFAVNREGSAVLSRLELLLGRVRLGALGGWVRTDAVAGLDLFVDLGHGTDLHGENTLTYVTQGSREPFRRHAFQRAVLGLTTELSSKLSLILEAYFNGAGAPEPAAYPSVLESSRFFVGEQYNTGRAYAGAAVDWSIHPLLFGALSTIVNLEDESAMVSAELRASVAENALLIAGSLIPLGREPAGVSPRSEFGLYPTIHHIDLKLYY